MSVKEIKELEDEVVEVKPDSEDWVENDFVDEADEEEKKNEFSIGDTMLARGASAEHWGSRNLEEELEGEEFDRAFDDGVFEEEEDSEEEGFSYDVAAGSGSGLYGGDSAKGGDLYGVGVAGGGGDLYGAAGGGPDLYGAAGHKGSDTVSMYNASSGPGESSMYSMGKVGAKKSNGMGMTYQVEGSKKKGEGRRVRSSKLESGFSGPKRRAKGVSMM